MEKWGNPKVEALDVVREAMAKIYDAKRIRTATAKDDARLKELHIEWIAMRKIGDEEEDWRRPTMLPITKNRSARAK